MIDKPPFDDEFIRLHARPGEEWVDARHRLELEHLRRMHPAPGCHACAERNANLMHLAESARNQARAMVWKSEAAITPFDRYSLAVEAQAYLKACRALKLLGNEELVPMETTASINRSRAEVEIERLLGLYRG